MGLYFKDDYHKETALKLMKQFEFETLEDDREYGSFCYLATATYKYNDLKKVIDSQLIDLDILKELM